MQKRELAGGNVNSAAARWFGQLVEVEAKPTLTVTSDPSGANVTVDGTGYGRTPVTLRDLAPGTHTVVVSMPGRQSVTRTVELRAGGTHDVVGHARARSAAGRSRTRSRWSSRSSRSRSIPAPVPAQPRPLTNRIRDGRRRSSPASLVGAAVVTAGVAIYTWRTYSDLQTRRTTISRRSSRDPVPSQDAPFFMNPTCNVPADLQGAAGAAKFKSDCSSGNNLR